MASDGSVTTCNSTDVLFDDLVVRYVVAHRGQFGVVQISWRDAGNVVRLHSPHREREHGD
jgi:hypothetical protein